MHRYLDKTQGLCPQCLKWVGSYIVEKKNKGVFLQKSCPKHGLSEIMLSGHVEYIIGLRSFYFKTHKVIFPQNRYLLYSTSQCNLGCPICFLDYQNIELIEIGARDLDPIFKKRNIELILFGAEPTCHKNLPQIIKYLKSKQHSVSLYTNGIKFSDFNYSQKIKETGVDKIYFQFDGFSDKIYETFRGRQLLKNKIQALSCLKKLGISVVFDVAIAKNINYDEIGKIFEYALQNRFIKAINFVSYVRSGSARNYLDDNYLMPDEIIDYIVRYTQNKISRKGLYTFQKLLYSYMSLLRRRTCFYIQYYWIYRIENGKYLPLEEILNFKILEKLMNSYILIKEKTGDFLSSLYLLFNIYRFIFAIKNFRIFKEWLCLIISHAFKTNEYANKSNSFLQLIFSTACDPYKADIKIVQRCHVGMISKESNGKIFVEDENGIYLLKKEIINYDKENSK